MAKLFAMENLDESMGAGEMEASAEVGEIADVEVPVAEDNLEIAEGANAVEEGVDAADQLEEVEAVIERAAEEGEGLDPIAAESIRLAVKAICARVGANPKSMYALYATENFESASSRKANTRFALEGVGEFLKDLWKKIKAAVQGLWERVKAFWDKHFSSLGRIRKAIDSTKDRVSESSGKIKDKAYIDEAPSSLSEAFAGKNDISASVVKGYLANHAAGREVGLKFVEVLASTKISGDLSAAAMKDVIKSLKVTGEFTYGTKSNPLVGGKYNTIKVEAEAEDAGVTIEIERETIDDADKKLGLSISDKAGLNEIVKSCSELVKGLEKIKEKSGKVQAEFSKMMLNVEKLLNNVAEKGTDAAKDAVKEARQLVKIVYKLQSKATVMMPEMFATDIRVVKAALGYVGVCLKNYK